MSNVSNALSQYSELGVSSLEVSNSGPIVSLFGADIDRAISLFFKFNNVVFIADGQKESEIIAETVNKICGGASGQVPRKPFQLDAKQFIKACGDQSAVRLEEILGLLENEREKILLVITSLEEFAKDERLEKLLKHIIQKSSVPILGTTTIGGFRQLEKKPDLAGCLQFILCEKMPGMIKRDKSVLIIGATSLLGSAVFHLFGQEYELVRGTGFSKASASGFDKLDVTSEDEIRKYFSEHPDFDIVVYIAGEADADLAEKERDRARVLNIDAVTSLSHYAKNCKFVYISSEYVFDGSSGPYGSGSRAEPINYYGCTKFEGEKASLNNFSDVLVVRLGALYGYNGPSDKKTSVSKIIADLGKDEAFEADNVQIKHPILLEDAARTLLKLLDYGATGIYQANGPEGLSKQEMAERIAVVRNELTGCIFPYSIVGIEQKGSAAKPFNTHMVNVDTPRPFNEGVRFMLLKQKISKKRDNHED
ncbi:MAG: sugar nucleotide-binding protein [Candidatus Omnitrophica bacterium]|nr:sugar nucleotide-binding protein [Candidatus Omnitrophota bacterium]